MRPVHLEYAQTNRFSRLVLDHAAGDAFLDAFRQFPPTLEGLRSAAEKRSFATGHRSALIHALHKQYDGLNMGEQVIRSLEHLAREDALTVTTGHQLCLFMGPLYVPFKLLNTIRLAKQLTETLRRPVVPVFWMATEDHDRTEIDHVCISGSKVAWPGQAGGAAGRLPVDGIEAVLDEAELLLGNGAEAQAIIGQLRSSYIAGRSLAEATRCLIHALFGRFGLIIVDGDDRSLKQLFLPVMREEVLNGIVERTVMYADEKLKERYGPQAHARALNLFHLRAGHRARIERQGDHFQVLHGGPRFTVDELLLDLEIRPQDYSPNVLMRPLYQETILPNIAYIGGGGELAYWMQLRWLFQAVQIPMPVVLLRTSAAILDPASESLRHRLSLSMEDLFLPEHELLNKVARRASGTSTGMEPERASIQAVFEALAVRAASIDPTLKANVGAAHARTERILRSVQSGMDRALRRRESVELGRVRSLRDGLLPGGGLQERRESILPIIAARGTRVLDELLDTLDPLDKRFTVLVEE
ncbi:MAG: bacillithiol biosynthesis cysteine-adding enzyme BshC [Flavobacteriales bacterium]|nr:bacillithiol biosynthesis cysteine-adding enzyme BshC [Flavobacteriales bacterium]